MSLITGNVPVSIPFINANLAISLPRVCKNSVPLQCKASGVPLPPPGTFEHSWKIKFVTMSPVSALDISIGCEKDLLTRHWARLARISNPIPTGPVLFGPTPAPAASAPHGHPAAPSPHAHSPRASKATTATVAAPPPVESFDVAPASPPKFSLGPSVNPGVRPVVNPNAASSPSTMSLPSLVLVLIGTMASQFL
ncbi:UNVERIFIED_CONTAM: hypothetical protein Sradi_0453700 [Sesamum radiatum]|uniref:Uncharacterized protein n=1 Tax=Sesamum radiatum TaxID=300843 RepID=A0AAW2W717_SESRA